MAFALGLALALGMVLAMGPPAKAGFADGVAAYDRGDYARAFREFRKAAEHNDATAQAVLGHLYATGQGVPQDMVSAVKWYRAAAEQGVAGAQNTLGQLYAGGRGVGRDYVRAHMWFAIAVRNYPPGVSRDNALKDQERIARMLAPEKLERARRMADAWLAGHPRQGAGTTPGTERIGQ
jgi:TPR repeat protein